LLKILAIKGSQLEILFTQVLYQGFGDTNKLTLVILVQCVWVTNY